MARTGLYPSEVKKARDALIAQGKHPSVDAVRVALGNTGSKTTIHKYLKELEALEGGDRRITITDALQNLVERLAAQLHDEADARIAVIQAQSVETARLHAATLASLNGDLAALSVRIDVATDALQVEQTAHTRTNAVLQEEIIERRTVEQQVHDLQERLAENDAHRVSLEEKHAHAREALEHYRQSIKEQRDLDQRRHEQQVQQLQADIRLLQQNIVVKQEDVTRLNKEGARMAADLSYKNKTIFDLEAAQRQDQRQLAVSQEAAQKASVLAAQLAERGSQVEALHKQVARLGESNAASSVRVRQLELALATSEALLKSQQDVIAGLRAHLAAMSGTGKRE